MNDRRLPSPEEVGGALAEHLRQLGPSGQWQHGRTVKVLSTEDLSPGLGQATVLRVSADLGDGGPASWIAKLPAGGNQSLLELSDPALTERETRFFGSPLRGILPDGLATAPDAGALRHGGSEWIFMRDIGEAMDRRWTVADAHLVAARLARLHAPVTADPGVLATPWLERNGYAGYAHHVPAGHENLELLGQDERLAGLFSPEQVRRLHGCLAALGRLTAVADGLTPTLLHGDLHLRNLGLTADRTLVLIDWEHVGVGPVGVDLATFVSLYRLFGGEGEPDERALLAEYGTALSEIAGRDLRRDAELGFAVCHLTWGLHLRLGPGLTAVRQGVFDGSADALSAHLEDVRSGALRALFWATELGIGEAGTGELRTGKEDS
ncbi:phosphotransferase family protein [Kitasatospora sp. NPDC001175]|uniref:phosphotransferase family protein n=1 Tax=Kitasatospora sp. NPDC001175 TaxID=3157103 RepID=UPI003D039E92